MLKRRKLLTSFGVLVPGIYSAIDACINEQLITYAMDGDAVLKGYIKPQVFNDIIHTATVLDFRGFPTFNMINDMRTGSKRDYYVDFDGTYGARVSILSSMHIKPS